MFGQMPGMFSFDYELTRVVKYINTSTDRVLSVLFGIGSGIGTGPGVIQDHYSPTFGRHRANPMFNGHTGNVNGSHQPQFENGAKTFTKPNQVHILQNFNK